MPRTKIAVTLETKLLQELDHWIANEEFLNRSQAIDVAVAEKLERLRGDRLARESAKLDPEEEKAFAEEGF